MSFHHFLEEFQGRNFVFRHGDITFEHPRESRHATGIGFRRGASRRLRRDANALDLTA